MILSDRDLRRLLDAGKLVVSPLGDNAIQPSSIDVRIGWQFRVFHNHRYPHIDPRAPLEDLTDLVEASEDEPFMLHPGEFVLASTLETVTLPDDHVARLEGKSSLGRLGLLIHSSLPASEPVLVYTEEAGLRPVAIGDVVRKGIEGSVVAFDPETHEISYHKITGWYEGPPDRIFEVVLASGRRVRVTTGHNLFTLDREGEIAKVRTAELVAGTRVAIPRWIPDPAETVGRIDVLATIPEPELDDWYVDGPTVAAAITKHGSHVEALLADHGIDHSPYYVGRGRLPVPVARQIPGLIDGLTVRDRTGVRGSRNPVPAVVEVDQGLAWLFGIYVAEGYRRRTQVVIANTDQTILDRIVRVLDGWGLPHYRADGAITACSASLSILFAALGFGGKAATKRVPGVVYGWSQERLCDFLEGYVDGDGSREATRWSLWTVSVGLVSDLLLLAERIGWRAGSTSRRRGKERLHQLYLPLREHKLLTSVPLPDRLLARLRQRAGMTQATAARAAGFRNSTDLSNIESRYGRDAVRRRTLRRLIGAYEQPAGGSREFAALSRLVHGGLTWDTVAEVRDTGEVEPIFDLEVRPGGRHIENFVAGHGGVFVSNTAGFVDAGWSGQLTLELSNVANLPIAIYPGMKIGQLCLFQMTSPAERPYGSPELGSKYKGQAGPTASKMFLNFPEG